jgi:hypothetical protein
MGRRLPPERGQRLDVVRFAAGQNEADRRHDVSADAASAQARTEQHPSDASVAIGEWVNRLELHMGDRSLRHGREIDAVEEIAEILEKRPNDLRGGGMKSAPAGVYGSLPIQF